MDFFPRNKFLHVEILETKKSNDSLEGFVLPSDYNPKNSVLKIVKLLKAPDDSQFFEENGKLLLVPVHMIESFEYNDLKICIVPENAVYGILVKNE